LGSLWRGGLLAPPLRQGEDVALQAPIDRHTHRVLRAAALELVEDERRRRFPTTVHAGEPGRSVRHVDHPALADAGLRADVALSLLRQAAVLTPRPCLWLTRPGELSPHDDDLRWLGPTTWACASLGSPLGLVVVTRRGWFDPVSDVRREWRRLRRRGAP
jgi:hypothetical protein